MIRHIDDGSMGGGGPITHRNVMTDNDFDGGNQFDINGDHHYGNDFTNSRFRIFHYFVFCHYSDGDQDDEGRSWRSGDSGYLIEQRRIEHGSRSQARNFMHELGHQLDLGCGHWGGRKTSMNEDKPTYVGYTSDEWNSLDLAGSFT